MVYNLEAPKSNSALETKEPIPRRRMTGLYSPSWPYRMEHMRMARPFAAIPNPSQPITAQKQPRKKQETIQLTNYEQINRRILLLHPPPRSQRNPRPPTAHLALRHLLLQTDRREYSPLPAARCDEVDGAKGRRRRDGYAAECWAVEGEIVRCDVSVVCAAVCYYCGCDCSCDCGWGYLDDERG